MIKDIKFKMHFQLFKNKNKFKVPSIVQHSISSVSAILSNVKSALKKYVLNFHCFQNNEKNK